MVSNAGIVVIVQEWGGFLEVECAPNGASKLEVRVLHVVGVGEAMQDPHDAAVDGFVEGGKREYLVGEDRGDDLLRGWNGDLGVHDLVHGGADELDETRWEEALVLPLEGITEEDLEG